MGSEYINADKYLQDIVRDKRYWEGKRQTIRQREKHMEETIERYQTEIEDLQKSRKEILRKAKEEVEQLMQEANARIENTIRSIKEAQAEKEKTRQARQELTDFRESMEALANKELEEKIARKMEKLKEKQNRKRKRKRAKEKRTDCLPRLWQNSRRGKRQNALQPSPRLQRQNKGPNLCGRSNGSEWQECGHRVRQHQDYRKAGQAGTYQRAA